MVKDKHGKIYGKKKNIKNFLKGINLKNVLQIGKFL